MRIEARYEYLVTVKRRAHLTTLLRTAVLSVVFMALALVALDGGVEIVAERVTSESKKHSGRHRAVRPKLSNNMSERPIRVGAVLLTAV